jgi:hypothetical protein
MLRGMTDEDKRRFRDACETLQSYFLEQKIGGAEAVEICMAVAASQIVGGMMSPEQAVGILADKIAAMSEALKKEPGLATNVCYGMGGKS